MIFPTMKLCLKIALFSYFVGDSVQFPQQQFDPPQSRMQFVTWPQQFFIPAKREVQQPFLEYGTSDQFQEQPEFQQIPEGGVGGQFQDVGEQQFRRDFYSREPQCGGYGQPPCTKHDGIPCEGEMDESGAFNFNCTGEVAVIENTNVLWLKAPNIKQTVHIRVPNYKIEELIQAGYKWPGKGETKINAVLQPPTYYVEAQRQKAVIKPHTPDVWFNYAPTQGKVTHFQNNRQYKKSTGFDHGILKQIWGLFCC